MLLKYAILGMCEEDEALAQKELGARRERGPLFQQEPNAGSLVRQFGDLQ